MKKKNFNPKNLDIKSNYQLMISGISPRPIAFVTSVSKDGIYNLAPYSFFNGFGANPPIVGFSPALSGRTGLPKDTLLNIKDTNEFTISIVNSSMVGQVSLSSCEYDKKIDEYLKTGLSKEESMVVKTPYVKESPFVMECKLFDIIDLGGKPASGNLILGEVVMFHVSEDILDDKNHIDPYELDAISRLGGAWYSKSKDGLFEYKKPRNNGIGFDLLPQKLINRKKITSNDLSKLASIGETPEKIVDLYNKYEGYSMSDLEEIFINYIKENKFKEAWTIALIIDNKS